MSLPISVCMIRKAFTDDKVLAELQRRLKYNKKFGSMTIFKCREHKPPCLMPQTEEEMNFLNNRLKDLDQGIIKA